MKIKPEHLMIVASAGVTLAVALLLLRWLAPQLLGVPADLRLVSVAKEVPPFYEGVFRNDTATQEMFILQDPMSRVRALPFYPDAAIVGPHDVLGFRNVSVPATADVVVIGDSQTYGINARLEDNWPSQMAHLLPDKRPVVYAMATGGWAAPQYLQMVPYALRFRPRAIVMAFYSGNDAAESFAMAYGTEQWKSLRPLASLSAGDLPPPSSDLWQVSLPGSSEVGFTPKIRLFSNDVSRPAIKAGWEIMAEAVRRALRTTRDAGVPLVVTIIPTKELVYADRIAGARISPPPAYASLVAKEAENIARFGSAVEASGARYVDVVKPLQKAALGRELLYPEDENGHPVREGYAVIAAQVARAVDGLLPQRPRGPVAVRVTEKLYSLFLVNDEGAWSANADILSRNGWPSQQLPLHDERDLATVPMRGPLTLVDRARFGPGILKR